MRLKINHTECGLKTLTNKDQPHLAGGQSGTLSYRYEVRLHPGQLTLIPFKQQIPTDDEAASSAPAATVIHLSDGDTRVEKLHSPDTFTLITHRNTYQ